MPKEHWYADPAATLLLGGVGGVVLKAILDWPAAALAARRERKKELRSQQRAAYTDFLAAIDDLADTTQYLRSLEEERKALDQDDDETRESINARWHDVYRGFQDAQRRVNRSLASIALVANASISKRADELLDVAQDDFDTSQRVSAYEEFVRTCRSALGRSRSWNYPKEVSQPLLEGAIPPQEVH